MRAYRPLKSKNTDLNSNSSSTSIKKLDSPIINDDYMSMDFILNAESFDQTRKQSNKRKLHINKSKKNKFEPKRKKLKVRMEEQRNKGLSKPIEENNIGFKLLSKMGYKNGMIIGKNNTNINNNNKIIIKEPIKIKIRDKNAGIGIYEMKEKKINKISKLIKIQNLKRNDLFKKSIKQKSQKRQFIKEIKQSVIICENLDTQNNINLTNPIWYKIESNNNNNNEDIDIDPLQELTFDECKNKLDCGIQYLRDIHFYCFYCGIQYKNKDKMNILCPGNDKNMHDSLDDF